MKKTVAILLSLVFLLSTVGLTVNKHSCKMAKKSDISLFIKKSCCGDKKMPSGCCSNETKIVKISDNYSPSQSINITAFFSLLNILQIADNLFDIVTLNNNHFFYLNIRPPLLHQGVSLPVLFRTILI